MKTEKLRTDILKAIEPIVYIKPAYRKILQKAINNEEITEAEERTAYEAIIFLEKETRAIRETQGPPSTGPGGRD